MPSEPCGNATPSVSLAIYLTNMSATMQQTVLAPQEREVGSYSQMVDMNNLAPGSYKLLIQQDGQVFTKTVVKQSN